MNDHHRISEDRLWDIIPLSEYIVPKDQYPNLARKKWSRLKRFLGTRHDNAAHPMKSGEDLRAMPRARLDAILPPLDPTPAVNALDQLLAARTQNASASQSVFFLIGQPHCCHAAILEQWAVLQDALLLTPPDQASLLTSNQGWLDDLPTSQERTWVLSGLERCFLRHANGLDLVRKFLDQALRGVLGQGVIGCDSWAWAYLQHIFPVPRTEVMTIQAFDGGRLMHLFLKPLLEVAWKGTQIRNASTGAMVLPPVDSLESPDTDNVEASKELLKLAAYCRGNVGTAWNLWRAGLRKEPDQEQADKDDDDILWLTDEYQEPSVPTDIGEDEIFVLHTLLLHNGLPLGLLSKLLPITFNRLTPITQRLLETGLITSTNDWLSVTPLGYVPVRELLHGRDYLVDPF